MLEVGHIVMGMMAVGLHLPADYFRKSLVDDSFWGMRAIHYPVVPEGAVGEVTGCGEHTDYGCLTMINQDDCPQALQVLDQKTPLCGFFSFIWLIR